MILACHGINKAFGEEIIVKDGSFHIEDHEKAALVGPNGAGKVYHFQDDCRRTAVRWRVPSS